MGALQGRKGYVTRTTVTSRQLKGSLAIETAQEVGTEVSAEAHVGYLSPQCLNTKESCQWGSLRRLSADR